MFYLLPLSLAFILSLILTGLARRLGIRYGIVSLPRARDVHSKPVPRIGGVAIFLAFSIVAFLYFVMIKPDLEIGSGVWLGISKHLLGIFLGSTVIVFSMLADDLWSLKAWIKLLLQCLAVAIVIASGVGIDWISNPFGGTINLNSVYVPILTLGGTTYHFSLWSDLLTLIWLVGMMNVVNFIDGVDGLAGGISSIGALAIFFLSLSSNVNQPATALLAIVLAGAALGFLVWNFPPAKIFMGDSGSMFLGFSLGVLALISGGKLATAFLALGFPIIDGLLVAGGRLLRGENPLTTPDKTHLHHRFLLAGFSVRQSILILYGIAAGFSVIAISFKTIDKVIAAFILVLLLIVLVKFLNRKTKKRADYGERVHL